jgi:hypothetical protein
MAGVIARRSYTLDNRGEFVDFRVGIFLHWRRFKLSAKPLGMFPGLSYGDSEDTGYAYRDDRSASD